MGTENPNYLKDTKAKLDYLKELLTDRNILANDPRTYVHVGKLLEKEISRIRSALFATYGINPISESDLPDPEGPKVNLQTKVFMPTDGSNSFNFVGRILGPDGSTAKCLQQCLGVKIMVRGRGSMRDRKKEEANIGKPNWEHLNERLHVVLSVEDHKNRAEARLAKASEYVTMFLQESMKGSDKDDKVKQMQLMELSFRREPCSSWRINCNSLLDISFPAKTGGPTIYPNATPNFLNFGYAYQPPMFSPLHHNSMPPISHLGAYAQQNPAQHLHQAHSTHNSQQQPQSAHALGNHLPAPYSHAYSNNLTAATLVLGHSPNSAAGYTSPYSPNSQSAAAAVAASGLALSYWSGQNIGQLPTEYPFAHNQTDEQPVMEKTEQNGSYAVTHENPEDLLQQYSLSGVDRFHELKLQDPSSSDAFPAVLDQQNLPTNGTQECTNNTAPSTCDALQNGKTSNGRRYSQKHACQLLHRAANSLGGTSATRGSRSAIVTVHIASTDPHSSPANNGDRSSDTESSAFHVPPKGATCLNGSDLTHENSDADEDWPSLGSNLERDKFGKKHSTLHATKNPNALQESTIKEPNTG